MDFIKSRNSIKFCDYTRNFIERAQMIIASHFSITRHEFRFFTMWCHIEIIYITYFGGNDHRILQLIDT